MSHGTDETMAGALYWGHGGVADKVWRERLRQISKWGLQTRPSGTSAREWKPFEDFAKALYDRKIEQGRLTWVDILKEEVFEAFAEEDPEKLAIELVQVMAVAASWLQDMHLKREVGQSVNYITGQTK